MIELASPSVEMSFEMRFQSLEVKSEDVVCGPTPAATFVRYQGQGLEVWWHTLTPLHKLLFSLQTHFQQTASFATTLSDRLNKQPFRPLHFFIP